MSLKGKRAFITGSFQGIGLGIATSLAAEGAAIVLHGLADEATIAAAEKAVLAAGAAKVESHVSDLRDAKATEDLIAKILTNGPVDILCNNAGIQYTATIAEMPREKWADIVAINLTSFFDTMRLLLPQMKERGYGRVINTASVHGLVASAAKAPYVSAKHGVIGLTKVAALEYAAVGSRETGGVTINAICPGWVETALIEPQIQAKVDLHNGDRAAGIADLLSEKQPSRRMSTPDEIGAIAVFLCSNAAHNITGIDIAVDGGWTAQ
ncbi:MAG: SDR family oxidoreductase [Micrococcales bacterium]|nr:SDR family oxidoreductase [Micrococcales bacterium]NBS61431.1 SDR family oxidoreductase [Microbacteriaceae bacterium]NBS86177.1 SDR family oxidoreductase [Micrococcales bacterium]